VGKALFIAVTQRDVGLTLALGVSGRRSIVAATVAKSNKDYFSIRHQKS